jgi:hypothetical protein
MIQSRIGMLSRRLLLSAGQAVKTRKIAKARLMECASVSLNTPKTTSKGKGDEVQSWNRD